MSVGSRFKDWGIKEFGSIKKFAESFGVKPPSLYPYFRDESELGGQMIKKILSYGGDLNWIFGGTELNTFNIPGSKEPIIIQSEKDLELRDSILKFSEVIDQLKESIKEPGLSNSQKINIKEILSVFESLLGYIITITKQLDEFNNDFPWSVNNNLQTQAKFLLDKLNVDISEGE